MAKGGIYDQLGGGFFRYSTDQYWRIPHFEKMLYDNGPLLQLYTDIWLATADPLYKQIVEETASWAIREMQSSYKQGEGGFYSSLDADSEHEEGKFYVWSKEEIERELSADEFSVVNPYFGFTRFPNFESKYWHLEVSQSVTSVAQQTNCSEDNVQRRVDSARDKLLEIRSQRIRPGRDEKILTSWNALMIKGLTRAGVFFQCEAWIEAAQHAIDFIHGNLWKDNRLLATYKDGKAHLNAYLDDYAFLLDSLLEMLQVQFRQTDFEFAIALAEVMLDQFEDKHLGGFFYKS